MVKRRGDSDRLSEKQTRIIKDKFSIQDVPSIRDAASSRLINILFVSILQKT